MIKAKAPVSPPADFPTEFAVDVDGEVFNVKISPKWDGAGKTERTMEAEKPEAAKRPKELPSGAVLCGMAGLILSIEAKVGDPCQCGGSGGHYRGHENEETCQLTPQRSGQRDLGP